LAGVDEVCVTDGGICAQEAGGIGGVAELGLRDLGECVAGLDGDLFSGEARRAGRRQNNLRAGYDVIRIGDRRIGGEQLTPAETPSEILLGELPEGIAALHRDYISFRGVHGSDRRERLSGREGNGGRPRRSDKRRRGHENSWAAERRALHGWLIRSEARRGRFGRRRQ